MIPLKTIHNDTSPKIISINQTQLHKNLLGFYLQDAYFQTAIKFQQHEFFYRSEASLAEKV